MHGTTALFTRSSSPATQLGMMNFSNYKVQFTTTKWGVPVLPHWVRQSPKASSLSLVESTFANSQPKES